MTADEFGKRLNEIEAETWGKVTTLVSQAREEDGKEYDGYEPVSYHDNPNWQRHADALAELAGWIYDRMNGRNRLDRRSMTKKIRKAIGYTYP